jgi:hypothetical protein
MSNSVVKLDGTVNPLGEGVYSDCITDRGNKLPVGTCPLCEGKDWNHQDNCKNKDQKKPEEKKDSGDADDQCGDCCDLCDGCFVGGRDGNDCDCDCGDCDD